MDDQTYKAGSKEDFDRLYQKSYQRILRTLVGITGDAAAAEDCTQDAFIKAYRAWKTWRQDVPAEAWLHRIAINTAISYRRRQRIRQIGELVRRLGPPAQSYPADPESQIDLLDALRALSPKQAAVIILRHLHGYSNREIGIALGIPESTVAGRLALAKRLLAARIGEQPSPGVDTLGSQGVFIDRS